VTLQSGEDVVIQFRPEPLDIQPFQIARKALGEAVPEVKVIEDEDLARDNIWVYWMTCIPGKTWLDGARGKYSETRVTTVRSLGRLFAKGYIAHNSEAVVHSVIQPHLELLLASEDPRVRQFEGEVKKLIGKLDQLKSLPLFIAHFDLNDVNVMIDDNYEVSGLIDWELSAPLPFGMGFCRIHTIAGEFSERKFYMPPEFDEAEKGFWEEVWNGIPDDVRNRIDAEAVQKAVLIGTLLNTFQLEGGKLEGRYNSVALEALPKFLTYRVPMVRGAGEPPYSG
jgi:hypothetical protein